MDYWTIEVADGHASSASLWKDAHGESLLEASLTHGAKEWHWVERDWGVLLELAFADESDWLRFRATQAVQAALDAVPDPINGLYVYSGRGGSSAVPSIRRPRPKPASGAAELPTSDPQLEPGSGLRQASFEHSGGGSDSLGTFEVSPVR